VVSNDLFNKHTGLCIVCPITATYRGFPFHVAIPPEQPVTGFVMVEQVVGRLPRQEGEVCRAGPAPGSEEAFRYSMRACIGVGGPGRRADCSTIPSTCYAAHVTGHIAAEWWGCPRLLTARERTAYERRAEPFTGRISPKRGTFALVRWCRSDHDLGRDRR
jgi:hypothetical protein